MDEGRKSGSPKQNSTDGSDVNDLPRTLFCLLIALVPLVFAVPLFEPYTAAKEIVIQTGTPVLVLVWLFSARPRSFVSTPIWVPFIVLAVFGAASATWSSHPAVSLENGLRLLPYILLFGLALELMRVPGTRIAAVSALIVAGVIEATYVLLQYFFGDPFFAAEALPGKWRTFGTFGNPNWAGEFLAIASLVTLGRLADLREIHSARPWHTRGTFFALLLMSAAMAATLARGAWLAFLVGAASFFVVRHRKAARSFSSKRLAAVAFSGIAVATLLAWPLFARQEAVNHLLNIESVRGRVWMWSVTGRIVRDAPWLGHGLGTFRLQFPGYQAEAYAEPWSASFLANASFTSYAHNDYLQTWAELGLPGLFAVAAFIWLVLKRGRKLEGDPVGLGCWAALISIFVNAIFAFPFHMPTTLMLLVVLAAAVEAMVCVKKIDIPVRSAARKAVALPVLAICLLSFGTAYYRMTAESALWNARNALQTGDTKQAQTDASAAIWHAPSRGEGYALLGRIHLEFENYSAALDSFDNAIRLGFDADVYEGKATALERTGRRAAAIETLNELVRLRPDLESPRRHLAKLNDIHLENPQ